ncbi:MAG: hypothetical protein U0X73_10245 [Thermoanaerobaculia bacterium]
MSEEPVSRRPRRTRRHHVGLVACVLLLPAAALAQDPPFTSQFHREGCTFSTTTVGGDPFFPLWPGYSLHLEGEESAGGETVQLEATHTVLADTELVDGVLCRVYEERESQDGELVEISRNFFAVCRETGDVWYFGEDVDIYEGGVVVDHSGAWRAGVDGAAPGIFMMGTPMTGSRYFNEIAPNAQDRAEVRSLDEALSVPAGSFDSVLAVHETTVLEPGAFSDKWFARGIGFVKDDALELVAVTPPPCRPDATTHCLNNGRFRVTATWQDFVGQTGPAQALLAGGDSGEFWFFAPSNTELLVKVLDACDLPGFRDFWVFAAGLTNVGVTLTVEDTASAGTSRVYRNPVGHDFAPVLDTSAFATCP